MATKGGSTLTGRQPSPKPPATSSRTPMHGALNLGHEGEIEPLKIAVVSILTGTEWPAESVNAAEGLITTVKSSPGLPENMTNASPEFQYLVKQYVEVLENVHTRLKDVSSKQGMQRWKVLQRIKSFTSKRPSKCTLLFQTCQLDVSKVTNALNQHFDEERRKETVAEIPGVASEHQIPSAVPKSSESPATAPPMSSVEHGITSVHPAPGPGLPPGSQFAPSEDRENTNLVSEEVLTIARKTFKSVEIASGAIPVVGNYVGAAAKVGLAFVETIQTMDKNNDLAKDLGVHTHKLTKLLDNFKEKSNVEQQEEIVTQIKDLHQELVRVKDKVGEWSSLGRFKKAFSSRDHAETLKAYEGTIQTVREEIQLLATLDTRNMIIELENIEMRKEQRRLLERLGDGKYGAQGYAIQDVICFPGTREKILERIDNWIRDMSSDDRVLWIRGMAGRGKSTIASTVVHNWKYRASCSIFHFRRGQNALNTRTVDGSFTVKFTSRARLVLRLSHIPNTKPIPMALQR